MRIIKCHQTKNPSYTSARKIKPMGIVVHTTGAVNPNCARYVDCVEELGKNQYNNHWNKPKSEWSNPKNIKSMHAFIGLDKNKQVVVAETLPQDIACWGVGGGPKGSYNRDPVAHLQFEICEGSHKTGEAHFREVFQTAAEYCAHLCRKHGIKVSNICGHFEAHARGYGSPHADPKPYFKAYGETIDSFRARVAQLLNEPAPEAPVVVTPGPSTEQGGNKMELIKGSRGPEVVKLQEGLTILGYPLPRYGIDGKMGNETVGAALAFAKTMGMEWTGPWTGHEQALLDSEVKKFLAQTPPPPPAPKPDTVTITLSRETALELLAALQNVGVK